LRGYFRPLTLSGAAVLLALSIAFTYFTAILDMVKSWWQEPQMSHGFLVPIVVAYGVWVARNRMRAEPAKGTLFGWCLVIAGFLGHIFATAIESRLFSSASFLVSLIGVCLCAFGFRRMAVIAAPLSLALFAIQPPVLLYETLTSPLQRLAAYTGEHGLDWLGYAVLRQGNVIHMAGFTLSVADACSGLGSLYSLLFVSAFCTVFLFKDWLSFFGLTVLAVVASIVTNALRIVLTAILGTWNRDWTQGSVHEFVGFFTFLLGMALILAVCAMTYKRRALAYGK
jgi:exosortase